jgi:hypothetical protein
MNTGNNYILGQIIIQWVLISVTCNDCEVENSYI